MMFYHVLSRLPDKCLVYSIESSNVIIHKKEKVTCHIVIVVMLHYSL